MKITLLFTVFYSRCSTDMCLNLKWLFLRTFLLVHASVIVIPSVHLCCWFVDRKADCKCSRAYEPFKGTLQLQSSGQLYVNTVIGTLAVDGWAVTFGTARRGLSRLRLCPVSSSLNQM